MPHPEREHELMIEVAHFRREVEIAMQALATALRERDAEKAARVRAVEGEKAWCAMAQKLESERNETREALAAARRECDLPESVRLIAAERKRQVEQEGWTAAHDDEHTDGELAAAASCYAYTNAHGYMPLHWPWSSDWWKPGKDRIRQLVKAGALIAAEIERLQRAALSAPAAAAGCPTCGCTTTKDPGVPCSDSWHDLRAEMGS